MNNTNWSIADINFLKEKYSSMPTIELAVELDRSYNSVISKAAKLNLSVKRVNNRTNNKTRICIGCGEEFPHTSEYFHTIQSSRDGIIYRSRCKKCDKEWVDIRNAIPKTTLRLILSEIKRTPSRNFRGVDIDLDFLVDLLKKQEGKCAITGIEMTYIKGLRKYHYSNVSIDRIDSSKGYMKDNVQLVCCWANMAKSNLTPERFKEMIGLTYKNLQKYA